MKCHEVYERMPDLAICTDVISPEVEEHLRSCAACAGKLEQVRQTITLLDEWRVPEPSPYFGVRVRARLREEASQSGGWWQWIRKPALAVSLAMLLVMSITLFRTDAGRYDKQMADTVFVAEPGTAVGDLQALERNNDLYSDFDLLDDLAVQQDVNATP